MEQADEEEEEEGKEEKDKDYTLCWIAANPTVRWVNNTAHSEHRQIYLAFASSIWTLLKTAWSVFLKNWIQEGTTFESDSTAV